MYCLSLKSWSHFKLSYLLNLNSTSTPENVKHILWCSNVRFSFQCLDDNDLTKAFYLGREGQCGIDQCTGRRVFDLYLFMQKYLSLKDLVVLYLCLLTVYAHSQFQEFILIIILRPHCCWHRHHLCYHLYCRCHHHQHCCLIKSQVDAFISAGYKPASVTYNRELLPS